MEINLLLPICFMFAVFFYSIKDIFKNSKYFLYLFTIFSSAIYLGMNEEGVYFLVSFILLSSGLYFADRKDYPKVCVSYSFSLFFYSYLESINNVLNFTLSIFCLLLVSVLLTNTKIKRFKMGFKLLILSFLLASSIPLLHLISFEVLSLTDLQVISLGALQLYYGVLLTILSMFLAHLFVNKAFSSNDFPIQVQFVFLITMVVSYIFNKIHSTVSVQFDVLIMSYSLIVLASSFVITVLNKKSDFHNYYLSAFLGSLVAMVFYLEEIILLTPFAILLPFTLSLARFGIPLKLLSFASLLIKFSVFGYLITSYFESANSLYPTLTVGILGSTLILLGMEYINLNSLEENITKA